jgi:hypothetical protein
MEPVLANRTVISFLLPRCTAGPSVQTRGTSLDLAPSRCQDSKVSAERTTEGRKTCRSTLFHDFSQPVSRFLCLWTTLTRLSLLVKDSARALNRKSCHIKADYPWMNPHPLADLVRRKRHQRHGQRLAGSPHGHPHRSLHRYSHLGLVRGIIPPVVSRRLVTPLPTLGSASIHPTRTLVPVSVAGVWPPDKPIVFDFTEMLCDSSSAEAS